MARYAYSVRVYRRAGRWFAECPVSHGRAGLDIGWLGQTGDLAVVQRWAHAHAAECMDLHIANWDAACDSCKAFGIPARACMACAVRRPT